MSVALDVLLTRVLAFNTPVMKIGLGFVAIAVCGAVYGPVAGAICGALGDIIGSLLFPTGAYFPVFTLTATGAGFTRIPGDGGEIQPAGIQLTLKFRRGARIVYDFS